MAITTVIMLIMIVATFLYTHSNSNLLQQAERKNNYYVLSDVVAAQNKKLIKQIDKVQRRYKLLIKISTVAILVTIVFSLLLSGRPAHVQKISENLKNRDIVLCLDVSGSTLIYDRTIIENYQSIVSGFTGERIGMSIFNSTSRTVFPLTDDYELINSQLADAIAAMANIQQYTSLSAMSSDDTQDLMYFLAGTTSKTESASLIGDGLANCVLQFPDLNEFRSRSIIFATDNILSGNPIYTLDEAATLVDNYNIKLYSIYSGPANLQGVKNEVELSNITLNHRGSYFFAQSASTISQIVNSIANQEQQEHNPRNNTIIEDDTTFILIILSIFFTLYLVVAWRLKQ